MQTFGSKSVILSLTWVCLFGVALILAPYYLGTTIAASNWQMMGAMVLGIVLVVLYFLDLRYLIAATALAFMLASSAHLSIQAAFLNLRWVFLGVVSLKAISMVLSDVKSVKVRLLDVLGLNFIALAFYSQVYSIDPELTFQRSISILLFYFSIFIAVWQYMDSTDKIKLILSDILKIVFVVFVIGFFFVGGGRFLGIFTNPNSVALLSAVLSPVALYFYLTTRKKWALIFLGVLLLSLVLSQSRSGFLSAAIGLGFFLWHYFENKKHVVLTIIFFVAGLFMLYLELFGASLIAQIVRMDTLSSGSGRLEAWDEILRLIAYRPWLGYGFGTEDQIFFKFDIIFEEHSGAYAHNSYLGLVSQLGLLGALLFFFPIFLFVVKSAFSLYRFRRHSDFLLFLSLLSSVIVGLCLAFFESWIYSIGNAFCFVYWILFAALLKMSMELK